MRSFVSYIFFEFVYSGREGSGECHTQHMEEGIRGPHIGSVLSFHFHTVSKDYLKPGLTGKPVAYRAILPAPASHQWTGIKIIVPMIIVCSCKAS